MKVFNEYYSVKLFATIVFYNLFFLVIFSKIANYFHKFLIRMIIYFM